MLDAVEVFQEFLTILNWYFFPNLLEDELVPIGDDSGEKGSVEERDVVFWTKGKSTLAEGSCSLLYFHEGGLPFEAQLVRNDEFVSVVLDPDRLLHGRPWLQAKTLEITGGLALSH